MRSRYYYLGNGNNSYFVLSPLCYESGGAESLVTLLLCYLDTLESVFPDVEATYAFGIGIFGGFAFTKAEAGVTTYLGDAGAFHDMFYDDMFHSHCWRNICFLHNK